MTTTEKITSAHIASEWDEGSDGYWIALRPGWKWAGDLVGAVHSIHEDTRRIAHKERVAKCACADCTTTAPALPATAIYGGVR